MPGQALRLLLQRDDAGHWRMAGIMDRRAPPGSVVASLSSGATVRPVDSQVARALEPLSAEMIRVLDGWPDSDRILEVGADVVLGRRGPALIEWNARPGRSFDRMGRSDLRSAAVMRPFERIVAWLGGP